MTNFFLQGVHATKRSDSNGKDHSAKNGNKRPVMSDSNRE
jgi:hypothetical protein